MSRRRGKKNKTNLNDAVVTDSQNKNAGNQSNSADAQKRVETNTFVPVKKTPNRNYIGDF